MKRDKCRSNNAWGLAIAVAAMIGLSLLTACSPLSAGARQIGWGDPERGADALFDYGCFSCHTIPGVRRATGIVGPPLNDMGSRWYIAGILINEPDNMIEWIRRPQALDPGVAMPNMGVVEEDARHMAAYLYTLTRGGSQIRSTIRGWTIDNPPGQ